MNSDNRGDTPRRRVLVTAALPYSNGRLHVGHIVGAYLPADIYVRFMRLRGAEVRFVCGSDDHGVAIMLTAHREGRTPAEVASHYHGLQAEAFRGLGIEFDIYSSTSRNPYHAELSQAFFLKMHERGYFEKQRSRQFFDEKSGVFLPDRFVKGTCAHCGAPEQNGDQCERCGQMLDVDTLREARSVMSGEPAVVRETVHWFLDLSQFKDGVRDWLAKAKVREHTRRYVEGLIDAGLVKRSMTRDLSWGVPVPLQDPEAQGKVLYVWFDAPIGYISNTKELLSSLGGGDFRAWWSDPDCEIYHFIGEDNTIFHCMVWIAMLLGEGSYRLPRGVIVNQFMNIQFPGKEEEKISKSRGAAVWVDDYLAAGGDPDAMRYYLTLVATERSKTTYRPEDLVQRQNAELANAIGNFVNRVLTFTIKNYGAQVPACGEASELDTSFVALRKATFDSVTQLIESFQFKAALEAIMEYARGCNKYLDQTQPWVTRKSDEARTKTTLAHAINAIHSLGVLLAPFLPFAAAKMMKMLGCDQKNMSWDHAVRDLEPGHPLGAPEILFTKIEG